MSPLPRAGAVASSEEHIMTCLSLTQNLLLLVTPAFYRLTFINMANEEEQISLKVCLGGLPWWLSGKESACQCGRHGFNPWSRKIPHAMEQLSLWAPTTEPALQSSGATTTGPLCCHCWNLWAPKPTHCNYRVAPLSPTTGARGKRLSSKWRPSTAKNK